MRSPLPSVIEDLSRRYLRYLTAASGRDYSAGEIGRMTEPIARPVRGGAGGAPFIGSGQTPEF